MTSPPGRPPPELLDPHVQCPLAVCTARTKCELNPNWTENRKMICYWKWYLLWIISRGNLCKPCRSSTVNNSRYVQINEAFSSVFKNASLKISISSVLCLHFAPFDIIYLIQFHIPTWHDLFYYILLFYIYLSYYFIVFLLYVCITFKLSFISI